MKSIVWKALKFFHIVARCPNCESAWTGGCIDPENRTHCIVCGDKEGKITGWVWGGLIDPFCWLGQRNVSRNLKRLCDGSEVALYNRHRSSAAN
jgi:hypothetical protein